MKTITPEEYLKQRPEVAVVAQDFDGYDYYLDLSNGLDDFRNTGARFNWDGYDPAKRIMMNPNFAWCEKREVSWSDWQVASSVKIASEGTLKEEYPLPDGRVYVRFGKYADEISASPKCKTCQDTGVATEVGAPYFPPQKAVCPDCQDSRSSSPSPFLPEGWRWVCEDTQWMLKKGHRYYFQHHPDFRNHAGYKHGGCFQQHTPGDPMPCDPTCLVDVYSGDHRDCDGEEADTRAWEYVTYWRPHLGVQQRGV